ncbi:MAG TPA: flagellar biosynthesis anti-sigma factor FlgM [Povalibacter sp.]|uniref:flagellar biosynthesis anti-sigma factor FlgM n=1 Tax=Povalibacter sp. TaxID=1962978 RepID=UPI002CF8A7F3|nr:flagellar biosynthesis anti-sigma factor FlgM [Povalibacter sp.]HMN45267.1 flagellar biosynthesis anti-sigma factor FlgM [Povalibacter sp.]
MSIKISDFQNRPVQTGTDKTVSRAGEGSAAPVETAVAGSNPVQITGQARQLASLEQAVNSLPIVNEARVAEISRAIEEGRYQVDAERIADKLLRTEQELGAR